MSVYFIRLGKYVKVGYSENPERRFRRLFSSSTSRAAPWDCPRSLYQRELLGYVPGETGEESRAHRMLAEFAVGCEFFLAEPASLDYIARCLSTGRVLRRAVSRPEGQAAWVGQVEPLSPEDQAEADRRCADIFSGRSFDYDALLAAVGRA